MIYALAAAFALTAILYASVGFGGGSSYAALLALVGFDYRLLPIVALCCNIVVVAGSTVRFARAGLVPWRRALLLTSLAAPAALLGGLTPIGERAFFILLGASLLIAGAALFLQSPKASDSAVKSRSGWLAFAAAPLGYIAGVVGIGGGIFLAPLLHLARWDDAKRIAATAALFILVNSALGLVGQLLKRGPEAFGGVLYDSLPLLLAVAVGGQIGSLMAVRFLPARTIRWLTGALTIAVGLRLLVSL